jgi:response regulator RpfG family c-di-GMP phosphodiesterase
VATLLAGAGSQWDPEVVEVFVRDVPALARLGAA